MLLFRCLKIFITDLNVLFTKCTAKAAEYYRRKKIKSVLLFRLFKINK